MSLTIDSETATRLATTRKGIENEFEHLPREAVDARFDAIVAELLEEASFGDFVPVLAWRYSREELLSAEGVPGASAVDESRSRLSPRTRDRRLVVREAWRAQLGRSLSALNVRAAPVTVW